MIEVSIKLGKPQMEWDVIGGKGGGGGFQSGGMPLICFPIYKTQKEKRKMTIFLFVFCKHSKGKRK